MSILSVKDWRCTQTSLSNIQGAEASSLLQISSCASMNMAVYQIYYCDSQKRYLDQGFIPLNVSQSNNPKWCEYQVFHDHYRTAITIPCDFFGFVSWKFYMKTHLRSCHLVACLETNPGADAYFVNPYQTSIAGLYRNVWTQLEAFHPRTLSVVQHCMEASGYDLDLRRMVMLQDQIAFCNYWIATKQFWEEYMRFTRPLYEYLEHQLDLETEKYMREWDRKNRLGLIPHIMERMFSTFLHSQAGRWKVVQIPLPNTIQETNLAIIDACNRAKAAMVQQTKEWDWLEVQDVLLTHMLEYKQRADRVPSIGQSLRQVAAGLKETILGIISG